MPYCPKCGVEVNSEKCPLCAHEIKQDIHTVPFSHAVEVEKKKIYLSNRDKVRIFNASNIFFTLLISSICITIDLIFDKKLGWSVYPIIGAGTITLITTTSLYTKGVIKILLILLIGLLMLFLLDITIPVKNFFLRISLPVSSLSTLISLLIFLLVKKSKRRGANIPGYILLGVAMLTVAVDVVLQNFIHGELRMTWSLITSVSLTPVALFLLYIHHVLSKRIDLNKVFHT